jgi:2-polyprenyl-6-methoxyphenol hydroxylase-like FAD-dependent oxidoreductase
MLLDDYERIRRPAAQSVLALAGRLTDAATIRGAQKRKLRNFVLSTVGRLPVVRTKLAFSLSGLARRDAVWPPEVAPGATRRP